MSRSWLQEAMGEPVTGVAVAVVVVPLTITAGLELAGRRNRLLPNLTMRNQLEGLCLVARACPVPASLSLKVPAEQCRDGSSLWRQLRATTLHSSEWTLPTTVVQPPLAESSTGSLGHQGPLAPLWRLHGWSALSGD